jgi:hypothetical protein
MKNKNEIIKNHLNISNFKKSLLKQQESLIEFYNNINQRNDVVLEKDYNYYACNKFYNIKDNNENIINTNIFNIRLMQTKENLINLSKIKWPNTPICKSILELKGSVNKINIIFLIVGRKNSHWLNI